MIKTLQIIALLGMQYYSYCATTIPDFTAVYDSRKKTVKIRWQNRSADVNTFIIQRSSGNTAWTDIALQPNEKNAVSKPFFYEDRNPAPGGNYYRLKCIANNNKIEYSLVIMIIIGSVSNNWIMFPVPVMDLLTLQYKGSQAIKGVITVLIQGSSGKIITRVRCASLTSEIKIPVSNLGRGIYDVRIIVEDEIVWNQRFVK